MIWFAEWRALSSRIRGLVQAGAQYAQWLAVKSSDTYGAMNELHSEAQGIFQSLDSFQERLSGFLPPLASEALHRFVNNRRGLFTDNSGNRDMRHERVKAMLTMLAAFEGELSFLLAGTEGQIRRRSERAFAHLQRSIVADKATRAAWQDAFKESRTGEPECEKLGAAHLLLHGIWAFKVSGAGARTDLVFGEPLENTTDIERAADGLVLTEWKVARPDSQAANRFKEARDQAALYAAGALSGVELAGYRYAVVVTERRIEVPPDVESGSVVYRHVNIAVNPQTPSRR